MAKELEHIGSVTSVGDLPHKMEEAEIAKTEVEAQILERVSTYAQFQIVSIVMFNNYFRTGCCKRPPKNGNSARRRSKKSAAGSTKRRRL